MAAMKAPLHLKHPPRQLRCTYKSITTIHCSLECSRHSHLKKKGHSAHHRYRKHLPISHFYPSFSSYPYHIGKGPTLLYPLSEMWRNHFDYCAFTTRLSLHSFVSNLVETTDICINIISYIRYTCICTCIKPTWNGTERLLKPPSCWNCKTDEMLCPNKTNELSCIPDSALEISY